MSRKALAFAIVLVCLICSLAGAQTVTIGPGVFTFPEIAQKLSTPKRTIRCAPEIAQRAAFVNLKARTWEDASMILSGAFKVIFAPSLSDSSKVTMRDDDHVLAEDRRWLDQFASNIRDYIAARVNRFLPFVDLSDSSMAQHLDLIDAEDKQITSRLAELDAKGLSTSDEAGRIRQRDLIISDIGNFLHSPTRNVAYNWLNSNIATTDEIADSIINGQAIKVQALAEPAPFGLDALKPWLQKTHPNADLRKYDQLAGGIRFACGCKVLSFVPEAALISADQQTISMNVSLTAGDIPPINPPAGDSVVDAVFAGVSGNHSAEFKGLGDAANRWLARQRSLTRTFMHGPGGTKQVVGPHRAQEFTDLSQCIGTWSAATGSEAVMELCPQQEAVNKKIDTASFKLTDLYDAKSSPWTFEERDKVLYVSNQLRFLNRWVKLPIGALLRYERAVGETSPQPGDPQRYLPLRDYAREVITSHSALWTFPSGIRTYRSTSTNVLDRSLAGVYLWDRLDEKERERLLHLALDDASSRKVFHGEAAVPLTRFDAQEIAQVVWLLRNWGFNNSQSQHPNYPLALSNALLSISLTNRPAPSKEYQIGLAITPPEAGYLLIWGDEAQFLWTPK